MPSVDLGAEVTLRPTSLNPPQPCASAPPRHAPSPRTPGPLGMLSGLGSQRPTLLGDALLHPCNVQLHLGNGLSQLGHLRSERVALRPGLLNACEQIRPAGVRIGHRGTGVPANA